jgi:excisionase family DNA binding protein
MRIIFLIQWNFAEVCQSLEYIAAILNHFRTRERIFSADLASARHRICLDDSRRCFLGGSMPLATYNTGDLAEMLGITRQTVRRYVELGQLPVPIFKAGSTWRWSRATVDAFLSRQTREQATTTTSRYGA